MVSHPADRVIRMCSPVGVPRGRSWDDRRVIRIRPVEDADVVQGGPAEILLDDVLGGRRQVRLGEVVDVLDLAGVAAVDLAGADRLVGVATCSAERAEFACLGVVADMRRNGVGSMLVEAVVDAARRVGLQRLWLTTTNMTTWVLLRFTSGAAFGSLE